MMPRWLRALTATSSTLNRIAAAVAAILLVLMVCLILVEIVLRAFSRSTFMADALVGYGVAATTFLALGWALEKGSMIRVSVLVRRFNARMRWWAEAFCVSTAAAMAIFLIGHQWEIVARMWTRGTVSPHYLPIPLWIPEIIFLVGLGLLALQLLVRLYRLAVLGLEEDGSLKL